MSERNSADYYRGRERQERALAVACINPAIAAIHSEMADRYADLVGQADIKGRLRSRGRQI